MVKTVGMRIREAAARNQRRRRKALSGPFVCPWCYTDRGLFCSTLKYVEEVSYIDDFGREKKKVVNRVKYVFKCKSCGRGEVVDKEGPMSVIDEYNKLYDANLSPVVAAQQMEYSARRGRY